MDTFLHHYDCDHHHHFFENRRVFVFICFSIMINTDRHGSWIDYGKWKSSLYNISISTYHDFSIIMDIYPSLWIMFITIFQYVHLSQGLVNVPLWGFVSHHRIIYLLEIIPNSWVMFFIGTFTNPSNPLTFTIY